MTHVRTLRNLYCFCSLSHCRGCYALCFALLQLYTVACRECAVNDYGAAGDGLTIDTNAIQRAIDRCSDGGAVLFSERSVYLVAGSLTIVGSGIELVIPRTTILRCVLVVVLDLRVVELPAVGVLVDSSADVVLQRVTVRSDWFTPGTSGVVVDGSRRVTVTECDVLTADDAVLLRTSSSGSSLQDFVLTASTLQSRSSAVRVGSEVHADIMRVLVADITATQGLPHHSLAGAGPGPALALALALAPAPTLAICLALAPALSPAHGPGFLQAPDSYLSGVRLGNVNITMVQATSVYGGYRDLRPGLLGVVDMTVPPFYARYLTHLSLSRVLLELTRPPRMEWRGLLRTMTSTVGAVDVHDLRVVDDAALPHRWEDLEPSVSNRAPHGNNHEADACRPIAWYRTWVCRVLHRWGQLGSGHLAVAFRYVPESLRRGCGEAIAQAELTAAQQRWDELDDTERDLRQHPRYASHVARSRIGERKN
ncbi:hypothetical protein QJQ45_008098 [Haematococcus lacustris]|nr:hypothetical protein QJQ45_008098 [Haematococcus lacustris]